jgi:hypothetical protein
MGQRGCRLLESNATQRTIVTDGYITSLLAAPRIDAHRALRGTVRINDAHRDAHNPESTHHLSATQRSLNQLRRTHRPPSGIADPFTIRRMNSEL